MSKVLVLESFFDCVEYALSDDDHDYFHFSSDYCDPNKYKNVSYKIIVNKIKQQPSLEMYTLSGAYICSDAIVDSIKADKIVINIFPIEFIYSARVKNKIEKKYFLIAHDTTSIKADIENSIFEKKEENEWLTTLHRVKKLVLKCDATPQPPIAIVANVNSYPTIISDDFYAIIKDFDLDTIEIDEWIDPHCTKTVYSPGRTNSQPDSIRAEYLQQEYNELGRIQNSIRSLTTKKTSEPGDRLIINLIESRLQSILDFIESEAGTYSYEKLTDYLQFLDGGNYLELLACDSEPVNELEIERLLVNGMLKISNMWMDNIISPMVRQNDNEVVRNLSQALINIDWSSLVSVSFDEIYEDELTCTITSNRKKDLVTAFDLLNKFSLITKQCHNHVKKNIVKAGNRYKVDLSYEDACTLHLLGFDAITSEPE